MKKLFLLIVALVMMSSSVVMAQDSVTTKVDYAGSNFTWGIGAGGAILGNGFGTAYSAGYGLDGNVGIKVDKNLAFLLAVDSYIFNTTVSGIYSGEVNVLPSVRYTFDSPGVKPYVIAGVGLNENIFYVQTSYGTASASATSLAVGGGVGIAFAITPKLDIYVQAKYEDVLATGGSFSYFPIAAGVQFN